MHLDLGPVAVLSILTGQLVTRYGVNPYSQDAVDFAGEVALAVGTIFCALSIFNIGNLMRFVSYPVMVMQAQAHIQAYLLLYVFDLRSFHSLHSPG